MQSKKFNTLFKVCCFLCVFAIIQLIVALILLPPFKSFALFADYGRLEGQTIEVCAALLVHAFLVFKACVWGVLSYLCHTLANPLS